MPNKTAIINLESLLELSARLNETHDEDFILNSTLLSLMGKLKILRAGVLKPEGNTLKFVLSKGKVNDQNIDPFDINGALECNNTDAFPKQLADLGFKYCFPIKYRSHLLAIICLGDRISEDELSSTEKQYANLVCTISANALANASNQRSLIVEKGSVEKHNQLLTTLFEMSRDFSTLLSGKEIIRMLSFHLMGQLMVNRFAIFQITDKKIEEPIINRFDNISIHGLENMLISLQEPIVYSENIDNPFIKLFFEKYSARIICPMIVQGKPKGILVIGKKMNGECFDETNLQFIEALSNTSIAAIENERLFLEELQKKKLESELQLALEIQKNLLPKELPEVDGYDIAGLSIPSRHVGGDYFDYIPLSEDEILVAVGDVAGKGIPAALLMANVQAALRVIAPMKLSIIEIIQQLNRIVYLNTTSDKFVTFFCGILNSKTHRFNYVNAGHNPPYLLRKNGDMEELRNGGLILGFMEEPFPYEEGEITFEKEDVLLQYTDGITEAINADDQEYGEEKLKSLLRVLRDKSSTDLQEDIVADIRKFTHGAPQFDDITLLVMKAL